MTPYRNQVNIKVCVEYDAQVFHSLELKERGIGAYLQKKDYI